MKVKSVLWVCFPFLASAAMLTVIQPPIGWWPVAWVSLVPFILACSSQVKPKPLVLAAYIVSLCYWLGNLYWVFPITIVGWATFCLYTALLWPMLALGLRFCRMKRIPLFVATPVLVVGAERLQGFLLGGFFWRFLAHSQYANVTLIQIADIFGAAGVSFLVAMVNGWLAELILDARCSTPDVRCFKSIWRVGNLAKTGIVCAAVVTTILYGRWRINQSDECVTPGPLVASLQSNVPQSVKRSFDASDKIFVDLMEKSQQSAQAGAELIVWPETMVQATLNPEILALLEEAHSYRVFDRALKDHAKDTAYVLVGAYGGGKPEFQDDSTIHLGERFNSAFLYRIDGQQAAEHYNKIHLVPFGEVLPFRKTVPALYNLLMKFTPYNYDYSLDYGSDYTIFKMAARQSPDAEMYKFAVIICYEDTVPAIARRFALDEQGKKRLHWLVNISNDGWFVRFKDGQVLASAELAQHAAVCAFRAVENRLAVLRSVNTGISCLIDSLGRIRDGYVAGSANFPAEAMKRQGLAGWFVDQMPIDKRVSLFSRYGEWLDYGCTICFAALMVTLLWARFLKPRILTRLAG